MKLFLINNWSNIVTLNFAYTQKDGNIGRVRIKSISKGINTKNLLVTYHYISQVIDNI